MQVFFTSKIIFFYDEGKQIEGEEEIRFFFWTANHFGFSIFLNQTFELGIALVNETVVPSISPPLC